MFYKLWFIVLIIPFVSSGQGKLINDTISVVTNPFKSREYIVTSSLLPGCIFIICWLCKWAYLIITFANVTSLSIVWVTKWFFEILNSFIRDESNRRDSSKVNCWERGLGPVSDLHSSAQGPPATAGISAAPAASIRWICRRCHPLWDGRAAVLSYPSLGNVVPSSPASTPTRSWGYNHCI